MTQRRCTPRHRVITPRSQNIFVIHCTALYKTVYQGGASVGESSLRCKEMGWYILYLSKLLWNWLLKVEKKYKNFINYINLFWLRGVNGICYIKYTYILINLQSFVALSVMLSSPGWVSQYGAGCVFFRFVCQLIKLAPTVQQIWGIQGIEHWYNIHSRIITIKLAPTNHY